jgi:hypothetical protein
MANGRHRRRLSVRAPRIFAEPDVSETHKRAVERALRWAWAEVCRRWPMIARQGSEEQVTSKLQRVLNERSAAHRRLAPGLGSFETVNRGAKVEAIEAGRIELMPDLVFRPPVPRDVRNSTDWGYFVECKIIDGAKSIGLYCTEGITRFANGEYCARMPSGGMLAYVRDGSQPFGSLQPRLAGAYAMQRHALRSPDTSHSVHTRGTLPTPCIDISLVHLWLCV